MQNHHLFFHTMWRRAATAAALTALLGLAACGDKSVPPAPAADAGSKAPTSAKPSSDEAAQQKARNTYVRVYNLMIDDNRSWAAIYKSYRALNVNGKSHSESSFYGSPDTLAGQIKDLKAARTTGSGDAGMDTAVDGVIAAGEKLLAVWEPMASYYKSKGFLEDKWAKAREADEGMTTGFTTLLARIGGLDVELERVQEARRLEQMAAMKANGNMMGYHTQASLGAAKQFVNALDKVEGLKNKEAVAQADTRATELQTSLEALSKAVSEAKAAAPEGKEPNSGYMNVHNNLQEAIGQWRVFKQSRSEMTWNNIISNYNRAIGTANRGFER